MKHKGGPTSPSADLLRGWQRTIDDARAKLLTERAEILANADSWAALKGDIVKVIRAHTGASLVAANRAVEGSILYSGIAQLLKKKKASARRDGSVAAPHGRPDADGQ